MQCRALISKIGDVRKVRHCPHSYHLPDGLAEGTTVKIVGATRGYYTVLAPDGNEYQIFSMCIQHPWEMLLDGRWWPEKHPKIQAEMAKPAHLRRVA